MEDLSHFIHEELFLVGVAPTPTIAAISTPNYTLGVVANTDVDEELQLLNDILKATRIDASAITLSPEIHDQSARWLVFADSLEESGQRHNPTKKLVIKSKIVILAHPLKVLRGSKTEKSALWLILKDEFGL